jgi:hypothetical protein
LGLLSLIASGEYSSQSRSYTREKRLYFIALKLCCFLLKVDKGTSFLYPCFSGDRNLQLLCVLTHSKYSIDFLRSWLLSTFLVEAIPFSFFDIVMIACWDNFLLEELVSSTL